MRTAQPCDPFGGALPGLFSKAGVICFWDLASSPPRIEETTIFFALWLALFFIFGGRKRHPPHNVLFLSFCLLHLCGCFWSGFFFMDPLESERQRKAILPPTLTTDRAPHERLSHVNDRPPQETSHCLDPLRAVFVTRLEEPRRCFWTLAFRPLWPAFPFRSFSVLGKGGTAEPTEREPCPSPPR